MEVRSCCRRRRTSTRTPRSSRSPGSQGPRGMTPKWVKSPSKSDGRCRRVIPDPVRVTDKPFLMPVEDVFTITGRHRGHRSCRAWA